MTRGDVVIANSEFTARLIRERYRAPAERIVVIPRGIDLAASMRQNGGRRAAGGALPAWGLSGARAVSSSISRG